MTKRVLIYVGCMLGRKNSLQHGVLSSQRQPLPHPQDYVRRSLFCIISQLVLLPECGHVPHEERAEDFLRLLLEQLSEEGAGDATITPDDDQPAAAGSEQE